MASVWLLAWNSANWNWEHYPDALAAIRNGGVWEEDWTCVNGQAAKGDRVYLVRVGAHEHNGIFAAGVITAPLFQKEHWDPAKKAAGVMVQKANIAFDSMVDYRSEQILWQKELHERFPEQTWAPQSSGIRIKAEYVQELNACWKELTEGEAAASASSAGSEQSPKSIISRVEAILESEGFTYSDNLIRNFYLSLKSKPFVILAGISGTGKTRLVRHFAAAVGATAENGRYVMIPVRPDWSDSSDLFGHSDLNGKFIPKALLQVIREATKHPEWPYFVCLDEMNLARVEYYLSDILSVIETRERQPDGHVTSDVLISESYYGTDEAARKDYGVLRLPENLYLIGTVNMDETTFPFSKKVLDRANTIEFSSVNLRYRAASQSQAVSPLNVDNRFFRSDFLRLNQCTEDWERVVGWCKQLQAVNRVLAVTNSHVGYRVRDEFVFYVLNNLRAGELIPESEAFDNEIHQKILPRIQGNTRGTRDMLLELFRIAVGDEAELPDTDDTVAERMRDILKNQKTAVRYPKTAEKLTQMVMRFEADGFTSFWL